MVTESTREAGDPLGLRVWAGQVASRLVPGLTNSTTKLRAYGLLCAGLECAGQKHVQELGRDEAWLRFERLWVVAQTSHAQAAGKGSVGVWPGRNEAARLLDVDDHEVRLDVPLLGHQLSAGTWGGYRRSAQIFGVLQAAPISRGTSPQGTICTHDGQQLSMRWRQESMPGATSIDVAKILASGTTTRARAMQVFASDRAPTGVRATDHRAMTEVLRMSLGKGARQQAGASLGGLRRVWREAGSLSPAQLHKNCGLLEGSQVAMVPQARAILWLFNHVERPYREYLRTGTGHPSAAIWDHRVWRIAEVYSPEMAGLRAFGSRTGAKSWSGTTAWAAELAARRGGKPTEPGFAPIGYDKVLAPAMALRAAEALFSQGLLGARSRDVEQAIRLTRRAARSEHE